MAEESDQDIQSRLDDISTKWTTVFQAHADEHPDRQMARVSMLHRYRGAVYRYLLAMTRDADLAQELCQEFALKFLNGDFHKATPDRGRFRYYVKTTVINLVRRHHRNRAGDPQSLPADLQEYAAGGSSHSDENDEFNQQWRKEILDLTWRALKAEHPVQYALLRMRISEPDLTSAKLAERYTQKFDEPMSAANVRKTLERAHVRFSELVIRETAEQLGDPDGHAVRAELEDLRLLKYCGSALQRYLEK